MQESIPSGVTLMPLPLPPEVELPPDRGCAICGSSNIEPFESYGETGVRAPDGTAEYQGQEGVHCLACGSHADEPEPRNWLAEAFQVVAGRSHLAIQRELLIVLTLHFRELASALCEVPAPKGVN